MNIVESILDQFKRIKNIFKNIKKLGVKLLISIVFPINKKLNKKYESLKLSIEELEAKLGNKFSFIKWFLKIKFSIVKFLKKIFNKNTIILETIMLDMDKEDNETYSRSNDSYKECSIVRDWHDVNYSSEEENINAGKCAYTIESDENNIGEYDVNLYFDSKNDPTGCLNNGINIRKKGKYLFCKDIAYTLFNNVYKHKNIKTDTTIESVEGMTLGHEKYKFKVYNRPEYSIIAVYEYKDSNWKYTCGFKTIEPHNLLQYYELETISEGYEFNIVSEEKFNDIVNLIKLYNIKHNSINVGDTFMDIIKDSALLLTVIVSCKFLIGNLVKNITLPVTTI